MSAEEHAHRQHRFARIRRAKLFLRFMPRRAVFHKYPLVGRFAALARRRSHLWSFKSQYVRPALYFGSILSLQPIMGVQLPAAFLLALLLRANFMVLGGLQFITNPATAVPLYYGTYELGRAVINVSGFGQSIEVEDTPAFDPDAAPTLGDEEPASPRPAPAAPASRRHRWTRAVGTHINALMLGGLIAGSALGLVLDLLWQFGARRAEVHRIKVLARKAHSDSTPPQPTPK